MVAALVPPVGREEYLHRFRDHAQTCFATTLYDDVGGDDPEVGTDELYNPAPEDVSAPHFPIPVLFSADLVGRDLAATPRWHEIDTDAHREFVTGVTELIDGSW